MIDIDEYQIKSIIEAIDTIINFSLKLWSLVINCEKIAKKKIVILGFKKHIRKPSKKLFINIFLDGSFSFLCLFSFKTLKAKNNK